MTLQHDNLGPLSLERFVALVDAYGTDLAHFPSDERGLAEALLQRSEAAQKAWQEAKALDALLGELPPAPAPSPALLAALETIPERHAQKGVLLQFMPRQSRVLSGLAAAAAVMLGVVTGLQQTENEPTYAWSRYGDPAAYESDSDSLALAELTELAFGAELMSDLGYFEGELE